MSDLRERLERRSERFALPPDALGGLFARGARVHRRRRVTAAVVALAIGAAGSVLAFSSIRDLGETPAVRPSPTPRQTGSIPDGTYWTPPITRAQVLSTIRAAGFTRRQAQKLYFDSLTIPFGRWIQQGLVIQDEFWFQTARNADGQEEAGWGGKFVVLGPHRVRATDNVCTITYGYELSGNSLSIRVIREAGPPSECTMDVVPQTAIYESAPFVMASPSPAPS
jgi:hypothetical protein